jgi:hypothetical protein
MGVSKWGISGVYNELAFVLDIPSFSARIAKPISMTVMNIDWLKEVLRCGIKKSGAPVTPT